MKIWGLWQSLAGGCELGRDCVRALFLFGKKRGSIFGIIVLQHDGAGAGLQTPGLHLISWRSAPGCWGHFGHRCSLLAAGAFGQTDKQETIFYRSRDYCYIFPSSVSVSLFKAFLLILEHATKWSRQVKTNVWRQEGILYWTNGHPAFCHVAAARGPSPALEMLPVHRARPGGWRPVKNRTLYSIIISCRTRPATSNQPQIVGTAACGAKWEKWRGKIMEPRNVNWITG